jgi:integrase
VTALKQQRQLQITHRLQWAEHYSDNDLVFAQEDGTPLNPSAVTHRFTALVASLRDPDDPEFRWKQIRLHDMRHGAASMMIAAGVPIETVQLILGHSSPAVTRRIYTHILRGPAAAAVEAAADLVRNADHRAQSVHRPGVKGATASTEPSRMRRSGADRGEEQA